MDGDIFVIMWPAQCACGHVYMERFTVPESWPAYQEGYRGFSYCGFCRTKAMHKPYSTPGSKEKAK